MRTEGLTAAILAGGLGTRLRSVVADRPKVLAEVQGRPFICHLLDHLATEGVETVVLCTGYMGDLVEATLGGAYRGMHLRYSREEMALGTGGALRLALSLLKTPTVLVLNGDSYCTGSLKAFEEVHGIHLPPATLMLTRVEDSQRFGRVDLDAEGRITAFREKVSSVGPGWVNGGVYLIQQDWIRRIPEGRAVSLEREVFPSWVDHGLRGYCSASRLLDIGVPEAYLSAERELAALARVQTD